MKISKPYPMSMNLRRQLIHTSCSCPRIRPCPVLHQTKCAYTTTGPATKFQIQDLKISSGEDKETVAREAIELIDRGKWALCNNGAGIERSFKFKTFGVTWSFMDEVAQQCKKAKHHPEWTNVYNRTHVRWTTHNPAGLSSKDTSMASVCDSIAARLNEISDEDPKDTPKPNSR